MAARLVPGRREVTIVLLVVRRVVTSWYQIVAARGRGGRQRRGTRRASRVSYPSREKREAVIMRCERRDSPLWFGRDSRDIRRETYGIDSCAAEVRLSIVAGLTLVVPHV